MNELVQKQTSIGELVARGTRFTAAEVECLFEADSPLARDDPYVLAAPSNTMRARRSDWRTYLSFCRARGYGPLGSAPSVVREFIEASLLGDRPKSAATVERYLSTIAQAHRLADLPDPTKTAQVRGAYRHLIRDCPSAQAKAALRGVHVAYALEHLDTGNSLWDLRAKALLAVAYCTMARRSELVALRMEHLSFSPDTGDGTALIRNAKVRRDESRYLSRQATAQLRAWLTHAHITDGPVFRRLNKGGQPACNAIAAQEVARIVQRIGQVLNARRSGAKPVWPERHLAAHSTRIGAAHDLAANGIDLTSIMHSGGWVDPKMPRYYTRELAARESGMARMLTSQDRESRN